MGEANRRHNQADADKFAKFIRDTRKPSSREELLASSGGVFHMCVAHDAWCKTLTTGNGSDCNCNPEETFYRE